MIKILILCLALFAGTNGQGDDIATWLSLFGGLGGLGGGTSTNTQQQNGVATYQGGAATLSTSNSGARKGVYAWGIWGGYGPCSKTCGEGMKGRQRACYFFEGLSDSDTDGVALSGFTDSIGSQGMELLPILLGSKGGGLLGGGGLSNILTLSMLSGNSGILGGLTNTGKTPKRTTGTVQTGCRGQSVERTACTTQKCPTVAVTIPVVPTQPATCLGQWSNYGDCSVQCGVGIQIRFRACTCRNPQTGRFSCAERLTDTKPCPGLLPCPVQPILPVVVTTTAAPVTVLLTGVWSDWGAWEGCSADCNEESTERRLRYCLQTNNCQGSFSETRACPVVPCQVTAPSWGLWGEYESCTQTCGFAQKTRRRTCPVNNACLGLGVEITLCDNAPCAAPVPVATWREWTEYGPCMSSCGPGERFRFRQCSVPGQCPGISSGIESCNNAPCIVAPPPAQWGIWGAYSTCTRSCGGGVQTRMRVCVGAGDCPAGDTTQLIPCQEQACFVEPVPQVGVWSEYGLWGECRRPSFGQGCFEERIRICIGANNCNGVNVERRLCYTGECAVVTTLAPVVTNANQKACDESKAEERVDCGYPGISREQCWDRGCCYSDNIFGTKWCFHDRFSKA